MPLTQEQIDEAFSSFDDLKPFGQSTPTQNSHQRRSTQDHDFRADQIRRAGYHR